MGNKVDIINEIVTRITTATGSGKPLVSVKRVTIGPREYARKGNDYPIVNISLEGGTEIAYAQPHTKVDAIELEISLITAKLDAETDNHLFNTGAGTGSLYLFEDLLDVIDETTAGAIDLTFNNTGNDIPEYTYTIEYSELTVEYMLSVTVQSKQFTTGSR